MEFICSKEELQRSLAYAEGVIATRTTLSILANVLIEAFDNSIQLSSTDLEVGFRTTIPANVHVEGSITLQAKKLSEIIKCFSNCNIKFVLDENSRMTISAEDPKQKANFKQVGVPQKDFPRVPDFVEENVLTLEQSALKSMIKKTIISVSTEEARYFLNGIYFEKNENQLILVATDGKRLSYIKSEIDNDAEDFHVIIPSKVLNELVKILGDEGTCRLSLTENRVFFQMGSTDLVSNLLEGQFPNYNQVIPKDTNNILKIDTFEVMEAIKRVSHMVDPKLAQIKFDFSGNQVTLYGNHPDLGEAKDEIEGDYKGENTQIAFNYIFLLGALREIDTQEVYFKFIDNKRPMIIEGVDDENYFSVIMPMKISED